MKKKVIEENKEHITTKTLVFSPNSHLIETKSCENEDWFDSSLVHRVLNKPNKLLIRDQKKKHHNMLVMIALSEAA